MIPQRLILASASPIRAELLRRNHVALEIVPAHIDEDALKDAMERDAADARDIVDALADMKARKIASRYPTRLVLGTDQVLLHDGKLFSKPVSQGDARDQLHRLRGQTHTLMSAAVLYENTNPVWRAIGQAQLTMRQMSDGFIESYIQRYGDDLLATVGCYKIEEDGASLFSRIQGDYFSIQGLPLIEVLQILRTRGVVGE